MDRRRSRALSLPQLSLMHRSRSQQPPRGPWRPRAPAHPAGHCQHEERGTQMPQTGTAMPQITT